MENSESQKEWKFLKKFLLLKKQICAIKNEIKIEEQRKKIQGFN